jgi:hypothetical protein
VNRFTDTVHQDGHMAATLDHSALSKAESLSEPVLRAAAIDAPVLALPITLLLLSSVAAVTAAVGVRYGWVWGTAAGLVTWGMVSALVALGVFLAFHADRRESANEDGCLNRA